MAEPGKRNMTGTVVFLVLLVIVVVFAFVRITDKEDDSKLEAEVELSEAQQLLSRDMENNYPGTPREVLKLYCRISKCLYGTDDLTADEIEGLIDMLRLLYDDQLLENNPLDQMTTSTLAELEEYHDGGKSIYSYTVDASSRTEYYDDALGYRAVINMYFTVKTKSGFERSYQEFVLLRDAEGTWKILGWRATDATDVSASED